MRSQHDVFLDVPFSEKDAAKSAGARWYPKFKSWFIPAGFEHDPNDFKRWLQPDLDQSKWRRVPVGTPRLFIDLVPSTCWCSNLRNELTASEWSAIKKQVSRSSNCRCEICGGVGEAHHVEAHEQFVYDNATSTQKLVGVSALCPSCHRTTHAGFAFATGRGNEAMKHLAAVNHWSEKEADQHAADAFKLFELRSQKRWHLDLFWLLDCGITLSDQTRKKINDPNREREFATKKIKRDPFTSAGFFDHED